MACLILAYQFSDTEIYFIERATLGLVVGWYASPDYLSIENSKFLRNPNGNKGREMGDTASTGQHRSGGLDI